MKDNERPVLMLVCLWFFSMSLIAGLPADAAGTGRPDRDFGFGGMEIFQFKNGTALLLVEDMNRDGLDDILFLNNKSSRIEVLIRKTGGSAAGEKLPRLKERFISRGFVLDQWAKSFRITDVNGDKLPDILVIGDQSGMVVYFQQKDGTFGEPLTHYLKRSASLVNIETADLDGDTDTDVLVCRQDNAEILWNSGSGQFKASTVFPFSAGGCRGGEIADIDGDGQYDLLFYLGGDRPTLRIRMGIGKGRYGWEETLSIPALRSLREVYLDFEGKSGTGDASHPQLAVLLKNGMVLRTYGFKRKTRKHLLDQVSVRTRRLPLDGLNRKDSPAWVITDFDADGYDDFCVAAPQLSQLHLYMGGPGGLNPVPRTIDSLTAVRTVKRTASGDIVVHSAAEKAVALHSVKNPERFPVIFKAPGKPVAMTVGQPASVFAVYKDKKHRLHLFDAESPASGAVKEFELAIANSPQAIDVFQLDGTQDWLIILYMQYEKPVAYRLQKGKLAPLGPENFRALSLNLEPGAVTDAGSAWSSAGTTLLVKEKKVARLYRWQNGTFKVQRQLNPRRQSAALSANCIYRDKKGRPGYLVYDSLGQDLVWFRASHGSDKLPETVHFTGGLKDIVGLGALRMKNRSGLLLVGRWELHWVQESADSLELRTLAEYTSEVERPSLWAVYPVKLGSPGRNMLALLDSNNRSIEIVGAHGRKLAGELVFEVFQDAGFGEAAETYEPHSLTSGDFNGDNIRDLAVLVHDKLIIYIGE